MAENSQNDFLNDKNENLKSFFQTAFKDTYLAFRNKMDKLERNIKIISFFVAIAICAVFVSIGGIPEEEIVEFFIGNLFLFIILSLFAYLFLFNFYCVKKYKDFMKKTISFFSAYLGGVRVVKGEQKLQNAIVQKLLNLNECTFSSEYTFVGSKNGFNFNLYTGKTSNSNLSTDFSGMFIKIPVKSLNLPNFVMTKDGCPKPVFMPSQLHYDLHDKKTNKKYIIWSLRDGNLAKALNPEVFINISKIANTYQNICYLEHDNLYIYVSTNEMFFSLRGNSDELLLHLTQLQKTVYAIFDLLDSFTKTTKNQQQETTNKPQIFSNSATQDKQSSQSEALATPLAVTSDGISISSNQSIEDIPLKSFTAIRTDFYKSIKNVIIPATKKIECKRRILSTFLYFFVGLLICHMLYFSYKWFVTPPLDSIYSPLMDVPIVNVIAFLFYTIFPLDGNSFPVISILLFISCLISSSAFSSEISKLKDLTKNIVVPEIKKAFGDLNWSADYEIGVDEASSLAVFPDFQRINTNDYYSGVYNGVYFEIFNPNLLQKRSSKNHTYYVTVFDGVVVKLKVNKQFKGHTIITKDTLFHSSPNSRLKRTELEDITFEQKYDVFTDDEIEARYLITTSFINRLNQLKTVFLAKEIECVFKDEFVYFIFEKEDAFEVFNSNKSMDDVSQYTTLLEQLIAIYQLINKLKLEQNIGM